MNSSPLPQPAAQTCPNCGAAVESGVTLCPNCGASLATNPNQSAGCLSIMAQVALAMVAVLAGALGACFTLLNVVGGASNEFGGTLLFGLAALVVAGLSIWGIVLLNKKKK